MRSTSTTWETSSMKCSQKVEEIKKENLHHTQKHRQGFQAQLYQDRIKEKEVC